MIPGSLRTRSEANLDIPGRVVLPHTGIRAAPQISTVRVMIPDISSYITMYVLRGSLDALIGASKIRGSALQNLQLDAWNPSELRAARVSMSNMEYFNDPSSITTSSGSTPWSLLPISVTPHLDHRFPVKQQPCIGVSDAISRYYAFLMV